MSTQSVCVRTDSLLPGLSCQLCNHLLKEATKISVCFHTFCRKCIYDKITNEELTNCPVCNVNLGDTPMDNLRPDIQLQGLRNKLFPPKGKKKEAPAVIPPKSPSTGRKKRPRTTRKASIQQSSNSSIDSNSPENPNKFTENVGQGLSPHGSKSPIDNEGENSGA